MNPEKRNRKRKGAIVLEGELLRDILLHIKCRIERGKKFQKGDAEIEKAKPEEEIVV